MWALREEFPNYGSKFKRQINPPIIFLPLKLGDFSDIYPIQIMGLLIGRLNPQTIPNYGSKFNRQINNPISPPAQIVKQCLGVFTIDWIRHQKGPRLSGKESFMTERVEVNRPRGRK